MVSVKRSAVTPSKSRWARTFSKIFHIGDVTAKGSDDQIQETLSDEKMADNPIMNRKLPSDDEDEEIRDRAVKEAFLSKLFASLSTVKAAYAQLQFAQSPYDADGIQSADQIIVSELMNLSELKQCYLKNQLNETSPEATQISAEIQEQKSLLRTYEIMSKKLDYQLKLKNSEITFLKEKLAEANRDNKSLEKRLYSSGQLAVPDTIHLSGLSPSHFVAYLRQSIKSVRSFVRLLINIRGQCFLATTNKLEKIQFTIEFQPRVLEGQYPKIQLPPSTLGAQLKRGLPFNRIIWISRPQVDGGKDS
ncbi:Hypothetical predicted protein [Olea europaea subsp. europaea]|uniref:DUF641 domain-containing protein n=1 Tax=Olea europaea subsp. europaea TaxID=158383 RepID=A0A8S0PWP8_OLEEU|nr:Hypothetical predicted protein [Olea europaea subsp. europaea]